MVTRGASEANLIERNFLNLARVTHVRHFISLSISFLIKNSFRLISGLPGLDAGLGGVTRPLEAGQPVLARLLLEAARGQVR